MSTAQETTGNYGIIGTVNKLSDKRHVKKISEEQTKKNLNDLCKAMNVKYAILDKIKKKQLL